MQIESVKQKSRGDLFCRGGRPSTVAERRKKVGMFKEEKRAQHGWDLVT